MHFRQRAAGPLAYDSRTSKATHRRACSTRWQSDQRSRSRDPGDVGDDRRPWIGLKQRSDPDVCTARAVRPGRATPSGAGTGSEAGLPEPKRSRPRRDCRSRAGTSRSIPTFVNSAWKPPLSVTKGSVSPWNAAKTALEEHCSCPSRPGSIAAATGQSAGPLRIQEHYKQWRAACDTNI